MPGGFAGVFLSNIQQHVTPTNVQLANVKEPQDANTSVTPVTFHTYTTGCLLLSELLRFTGRHFIIFKIPADRH